MQRVDDENIRSSYHQQLWQERQLYRDHLVCTVDQDVVVGRGRVQD